MNILADDPEVIPLGQMAVFYLPAKHLQGEVGVRLDATLIADYQGMTKITQAVEGHFQMGPTVVKDDHVRYEVAFLGKDRVPEFIALLKQVCRDLGEQSIYVTMGEKAYLIHPK